jgi:hypothetical protein
MRPAPIARMRSYLRTAVFVLALVSLAMSLIAVSVRFVGSPVDHRHCKRLMLSIKNGGH